MWKPSLPPKPDEHSRQVWLMQNSEGTQQGLLPVLQPGDLNSRVRESAEQLQQAKKSPQRSLVRRGFDWFKGKGEADSTIKRVQQAIPAEISQKNPFLLKAKPFVRELLMLLDPALQKSDHVVKKMTEVLANILEVQGDSRDLKELIQRYKEFMPLMRDTATQRIATDTPLSCEENLDFAALTLHWGLLSLGGESRDGASFANAIAGQFFHLNEQILYEALPSFYHEPIVSPDQAVERMIDSHFNRLYQSVGAAYDLSLKQQTGAEQLDRAELALRGAGYSPHDAIAMEKVEWIFEDMQPVEGKPQLRFAQKGFMQLGMAIPGVCAREGLIPLDLSALGIETHEELVLTIKAVQLCASKPPFRLILDLYNEQAQAPESYKDLEALLAQRQGALGEVKAQLEKQNPDEVKEELETAKAQLAGLAKALEVLEDLSKGAFGSFRDETLASFMEAVTPLVVEGPKLLARLHYSVYNPTLELPPAVQDVTAQLFNEELHPLIDKVEDVIGRKLFGPNELRFLHIVLMNPEFRQEFEAFCDSCMEVKAANKQALYGRIPFKQLYKGRMEIYEGLIKGRAQLTMALSEQLKSPAMAEFMGDLLGAMTYASIERFELKDIGMAQRQEGKLFQGAVAKNGAFREKQDSILTNDTARARYFDFMDSVGIPGKPTDILDADEVIALALDIYGKDGLSRELEAQLRSAFVMNQASLNTYARFLVAVRESQVLGEGAEDPHYRQAHEMHLTHPSLRELYIAFLRTTDEPSEPVDDQAVQELIGRAEAFYQDKALPEALKGALVDRLRGNHQAFANYKAFVEKLEDEGFSLV